MFRVIYLKPIVYLLSIVADRIDLSGWFVLKSTSVCVPRVVLQRRFSSWLRPLALNRYSLIQVVAGATMAALNNEAELLGAMHISRLLMTRRCHY
eukprot:scaffold36557_cov45-Cyclotella_meneghiniana.AAC.1